MKNLETKNNIDKLCFFKTEKDLCVIASKHLSENIEENVKILKKLLTLKNKDIIEINNFKIVKRY